MRTKFKIYLRRSSCRPGRRAAWSYLRSSNLFLREENPIWLFDTGTFYSMYTDISSLLLLSISRQTFSCEVITGWPGCLWPLRISNNLQRKKKWFPTSWHHDLGTRQLGPVAFCQILLYPLRHSAWRRSSNCIQKVRSFLKSMDMIELYKKNTVYMCDYISAMSSDCVSYCTIFWWGTSALHCSRFERCPPDREDFDGLVTLNSAEGISCMFHISISSA